MTSNEQSSVDRLSGASTRRGLIDGAVLFSGVVGTGVIVVLRGRDLNRDLLNYHFDNGWAAWTGHVWSNYGPGRIQTFLNPALDMAICCTTRGVVPYV